MSPPPISDGTAAVASPPRGGGFVQPLVEGLEAVRKLVLDVGRDGRQRRPPVGQAGGGQGGRKDPLEGGLVGQDVVVRVGAVTGPQDEPRRPPRAVRVAEGLHLRVVDFAGGDVVGPLFVRVTGGHHIDDVRLVLRAFRDELLEARRLLVVLAELPVVGEVAPVVARDERRRGEDDLLCPGQGLGDERRHASVDPV